MWNRWRPASRECAPDGTLFSALRVATGESDGVLLQENATIGKRCARATVGGSPSEREVSVGGGSSSSMWRALAWARAVWTAKDSHD